MNLSCPGPHTVPLSARLLSCATQLALAVAIAFFSAPPADAAIAFVQANSAVPTNVSSISATYTLAQTAGNLNVVVIGWSDTANTVKSVTDSKGNLYRLAVTSTSTTLGVAQAIYYSSNILASAAGANKVIVTMSATTGFPDLRILEYSGVGVLDKTSTGTGTAATADSGGATTTQANELLFGADYTWGATTGPGSGYTQRVLTGDSDIAEDRTVTATGSYHATAATNAQNWIIQLATFYAAGVTVTVSPTSAAVAPGLTQQFTATVTGSSNTAVTWQVNGVTGGNSTVGTVSTSGLYTAPSTIPNPPTVTVTAVSQADSTKSASASVTVSNGLARYVSTAGNDANSGTSSSPWRTIQHAATVAQPGDTIYVAGGVYNESVTISVSGNATSGYITFQSAAGQTAIVDGTGVSCCGGTIKGLFNITNQSFIAIKGFEIRNFSTTSSSEEPTGILIQGSGSNLQILNNLVHNITTSKAAETAGGNAHGIGVYGQTSTPISNLTISGNQVYSLKTGWSESVTIDGNVTNFTITNNIIHDNDNIGLDMAGFFGVGPSGSDQANTGVVSGNTVYNITSLNNGAYGGSLGADGIYCDGCSKVIIERNLVYACDLNIEVASENTGKTGSFVTVRNNVLYNPNLVNISIGGAASSNGGADHVAILNNTIYNNASNSGDSFWIQYHSTNNAFENNVVYGDANGGALINNTNSGSAAPIASDYNVFFTTQGATGSNWFWKGTGYVGFANFKTASGQDSHSQFADPKFVNATGNPPNLDVLTGSPAINSGITTLSCSIAYCGTGTSIYGTADYAGNPRFNSSGQINAGAYEQ